MTTGKPNFIERKTPHKSWRVKRVLHNDRELAFAEEWADQCEPKRWTGGSLAQMMFCRQKTDRYSPWGYSLSPLFILNNKENMMLATLIQWLGTNVGFAFLETVLNRCGYKIVKIEQGGKR